MIFEFGDRELDTERYELRHAGAAVHLEPQVFDLLVVLAANRDRVVSKAELLDTVWGDRFVSESTLTSRVRTARRAVDDDGTEQRVIRTVHGRGYRFIAPVVTRPGRAPGAMSPTGAAELLERDAALQALGAALDRVATGAGQVVLVAGEPGIGKTALLRAFTSQVGDRARVLSGGCDDLITPRPFAPLHDLTGTGGDLATALAAGAPAAEVHRLVLHELDGAVVPTVLVVEDAHWADEATLDLATFLVRRIAGTRGLLVLTYRDTELGEDHPLVGVIGSIPSGVAVDLRLDPLSFDAVVGLVGRERAPSVMAVTQGNPFFVTELAAAGSAAVPASVRHAVLARVAHLAESIRQLLALIAVAPVRLEFAVLDEVCPDWTETIAAGERAGMVLVEQGHVQFRHELARQAVFESTPAATRRRLHLDLLRVLVARDVDPARIVHHAEGAGDQVTLARYALRAARQAAALPAHREAHSQYRRALQFVDDLELEERARIHEEASREAYVNAAEVDALADASAALDEYEQLSDALGAGRVHRWLSRLHWYGGRRAEADAAGRRAVEVLEPLERSTELAWAYSNLSQLAMLAARNDEARAWGARAIALADELGDDVVRAHALVNVGTVEMRLGPFDARPLLEAFAAADAVGERHEATRALLNLAFQLVELKRLDAAAEMADRALAYADQHEVDALAQYLRAMIGRIDVLRGRWDAAEPRLREALAGGGFAPRMLALESLALLQVRRGDDEAPATLALAREHAVAADEIQRLAPVAVAEAEHAWLVGRLAPGSPDLQRCYDEAVLHDPVYAGELARWMLEAGAPPGSLGGGDEVYRLEIAGEWEAAAAIWDDRGMPYDRALCLAHLEHRRDEALAVAEQLGAAPLAARLAGGRAMAAARRRRGAT